MDGKQTREGKGLPKTIAEQSLGYTPILQSVDPILFLLSSTHSHQLAHYWVVIPEDSDLSISP